MIGNKKGALWLTLVSGVLALAGCSGGGDGGDQGPATGTISFGMTDLAIDNIDAVVIAMTEFELKPVGDGPAIRIPVNGAGRELNLLDFQNGESATVIDGEEVEAGDYESLRIFFDESLSYVMTDDGMQFPLRIPSGAQTGYKLQSGFTVPINASVEYIIHVDLAQSLKTPPGLATAAGPTYLLRPVAQIMNTAETGSVMGAVDMSLIDVNNMRCTDDIAGNAAYIFDYDGVEALVDDIADPETDDRVGPFATDQVALNIDSGNYEYNFANLLPGDYVIAFTCSTGADDELSDDDYELDEGGMEYIPGESGFDFDQVITVRVASNVDSVCPIPAGDAPAEICEPPAP